MRLTARVPATSANLGPGFDCFGLALDLCNEVTIDTDAEPGITWEGEGADELPTDGSDLVSRAIARGMDGGEEPPPMRIHGVNRIPLQRGLGSSAAATVAGLALAGRLRSFGEMSPDLMLALATGIEGHPDNAAAAIHGGLTLAVYRGRKWLALPLRVHPSIQPVLLIPESRISTIAARNMLPETVPLADAATNAARAAVAVLALTRGDEWLDILDIALEDLLHQAPRLALVPHVRDVFARLRGEGVPVCLSGSGPALLAFERPGTAVPDPGPDWRVLRVPVRSTGVEVFEP